MTLQRRLETKSQRAGKSLVTSKASVTPACRSKASQDTVGDNQYSKGARKNREQTKEKTEKRKADRPQGTGSRLLRNPPDAGNRKTPTAHREKGQDRQ